MKKIFSLLFSLPVMALLLVFYGISMALATFIENDFGTPIAKEFIYNAWWFELIMLLLAFNLVANLFKYKLYQKKKLSIFLFHLAFIIMLGGAFATRYFGFEGIIHFREGSRQDFMLSEFPYLTASVDNKNLVEQKALYTPFSFQEFSLEMEEGISVNFTEFLPNAKAVLNKVEYGNSFIELVFSSNGNLVSYPLEQNGVNVYKNISFLIGSKTDTADILFYKENQQLYILSKDTLFVADMNAADFVKHSSIEPMALQTNMLYTTKGISFVVKDFHISAQKDYLAGDYKMSGGNINVLKGFVSDGKEFLPFYLVGNTGSLAQAIDIDFKQHKIQLSYGLKKLKLPFTIELLDFQLERYPGSESPASYASLVQVIDNDENMSFPYKIYMNNVLDYKGYRIFQSSYDSDEQGSVLSVNFDKLGTYLTYLSYFLMSLGMLWSLVNPASRFLFLMRSVSKLHKGRIAGLFLLLFLASNAANGQQYKPIAKEHAARFGQIYIQTTDGRVKTISSLSSEILRKLSRKTTWNGLTPEQVFMGITFHPDYWLNEPILRISDKELARTLGVSGKYIAFNALVDLKNQTYALRDKVNAAYEKSPAYRNTYDKELIKLDEKVNIFYMLYTGQFLNVFPNPDDLHKPWLIAGNQDVYFRDTVYLSFYKIAFLKYSQFLGQAATTQNYTMADEFVNEIKTYQHKYAAELLPSEFKSALESVYERVQVFERIFPWYAIIGFVLLILLFLKVLNPALLMYWPLTILKSIVFIIFFIHTLALASRWYISGHAPWSDGYEAMVYIAWSLMLAGTVYARKSPISLAGSSLLASVMLMVAHLNWMDPTITNLVPVLNSYWLSIHVSIITASYGFLGLGSLLGLLVLILFILQNQKNYKKLWPTIKELSMVNEMNLTIGLYMLTIGTFLGGVWANESWGRYWGWDPKETWALISVVVYVFVVHMRLIPGLRGYFAFNFAAMAAYASIIMTFFGVNFYLSGLHSYAKGDPVPIPSFIYYLVLALLLISLFAFINYKKNLNNKLEA